MPKLTWRDEYYVKAHEMAREGLGPVAIADALGIPYSTWKLWWRKRPALRQAVNSGRSPSAEMTPRSVQNGSSVNTQSAGERFQDYVEKRLPIHLKEIWERIQEADVRDEGDVPAYIERLFADQGKGARQHLWIHVMMVKTFNVSEACRMVNISRKTLEKWVQEDPGFRELFASIHTIKKDFCESALMAGVYRGEASLIKFANATLNGDRGYNPRVIHHHYGSIDHLLKPVELEAMSIEERKALREKIREQRMLPPKVIPGVVEETNRPL